MKLLITKIVPYKDKDAIINGFNETQNFSILCRGILNPKSKNAALNNPMTLADIELSENNKSRYDVLKSSTIEFSPMELIGKSTSLVMTMFLNEIVNKCLTEDEKTSLYSDILFLLKHLKNSNLSRFYLLNFISKVLQIGGFCFNVDSCQICNTKKSIIGFSLQEGGFVCKDCIKDYRDSEFTSNELLWIRKIFKYENNDYSSLKEDLTNEEFRHIFSLLIIFIEDNYGFKFSNLDLLIN